MTRRLLIAHEQGFAVRLHPGHQKPGTLGEVGRLTVVDALADGESGDAASQGRLRRSHGPGERGEGSNVFSEVDSGNHQIRAL